MDIPEPIFRILFVCTGNTCRSPMAEGVLRKEMGAEGRMLEVGSAGMAAAEGAPATAPSIEVAGRDGVDLNSHRSRRLTRALVNQADLILVMEPGHGRAARELGGLPSKVRLLSEWPEPGDPSLPVDDPLGQSIEAYEECWRRIRTHVMRLIPHVREELRARQA